MILSDRGKEFLVVVTSVCRCLQIRQIRTTPYHPRTNGLWESQHKTLTLELKIRSSRDSAPEWSNLLTEMSFACNVTPSKTADALSPFNLIFGRKPRLSAKDICFPVKAHPVPVNQPEHRIKFEAQQRKILQGLQFKALDATKAAKETMREQHDKARADAVSTKGLRDLVVGDIVCVSTPRSKLPKLTFQWSEPTYIITTVYLSNVSVRNLSNLRGGMNTSAIS